jgi:SWI/SNF-related matrix-associated actin-dependent regulator of chromatin subfamily A3
MESQDSRSLVIEGIIAGEKGSFDCPILLKLYGPLEITARARLEARLKADKLPIKTRAYAAPKKPSHAIPTPRRPQDYTSSQSQASSSQPEPIPELSIQDFIASSESFRPRDVQEIVEQWGAGEDALSKMPMAKQPEGLISTLLPYQRQGLAWMLEKENPVLPAQGSTEICQLWKRDPRRPQAFFNIASGHSSNEPPRLARGGILADDMGLGKTLQVISLILEGVKGSTLILAPVSVMSNWAQQIERHVNKESALRVLTYHGSNRKGMTARDFSKYDVVITTYGTLGTEYMPRGIKSPEKIPRKDGLFSMNWARVVLDEGHQIRNYSTRAAVSATNLLARCRWVLTGTPIVNSIKDLYSMLRFLAISGGLERMELFNSILARPLAVGNAQADLVLQTVMRTFCLRRKKDMKFVDLKLPELSEYVHRITFRQDERKKYEALQ